MKTANLLDLIEAEAKSFEAKKAEKGIMAALFTRKDYAYLWAKENKCETPSVKLLRENLERDLSDIAKILPPRPS